MSGSPYDEAFYGDQQEGSARSAAVVVPLFLAHFPIASVVDVGCGVGGWLAAFRSAGVGDVTGVDGSYVPTDRLMIDPARFLSADLSQPLALGRTFDAAVCLEVAEHLSVEAGDALVASLCDMAPIVLFSAAIPCQGGTDHVNEQWQSYWAYRFAARGLVPLDLIRPAVTWDQRVEFWYRQNTLVYCRPEKVPHGTPWATIPYDTDRVDLELYCYQRLTLRRQREP